MVNRQDYFTVDEIAKNAALQALRLFRKEEKELVKKTRLHNTGLLLDHYIDFIDHYENIKYKASDIQEELNPEEIDSINHDDIIIQSIKRSKIRTKVMIRQIETALMMLKTKMKLKEELEKYKVVESLYMDRKKKDIRFNERISKVAEEIKCHETTVRRWNSEMLNELSILLFGIDGLKLEL